MSYPSAVLSFTDVGTEDNMYFITSFNLEKQIMVEELDNARICKLYERVEFGSEE